jgi:hypothetical protein
MKKKIGLEEKKKMNLCAAKLYNSSGRTAERIENKLVESVKSP